jgi:NADH dehydrogenase
MLQRVRRVVILGAGFAGSYVARLLGRHRGDVEATLVDPHNFMLYTPLLPEAASGTVEPRHVLVPVRVMCPHARLVLGEADTVDLERRTVTVRRSEGAPATVDFDSLVVALGAVARTAPIPGLLEHAVGFKSVAEAIYLRNQVLGQLELAATAPDEAERRRRLTFVFVGGGYAGVEAMAELEDMCRDAGRYYPELRGVPRRWLLVDMAARILPELGGSLAPYATRQLEKRGFELHLGTGVRTVDEQGVELSDGTAVPTATLVWTAGVRPHPLAARLGLPVDERGRVPVDQHLRVPGHANVWALGDVAAVPNAATPGMTDPPTCQHALRQARRLARNIAADARGRPLQPYRYRMLGQAATLGRHKGVFEMLGTIRLRGFPGWWLTRSYHLYQLPLASRKLRVVTDWTVGLFFRRDVVELGSLGKPVPLEPPPPRA